ncbi:hypothetical protein PybrP1_010749, partial [[Pythium] brassicae (nom. inval.)]
GIPGDDAE